MKNIITILLLTVSSFSLVAQTINWAKRATGSGLDQGNGITIDGSGNSYIVGEFESTTLNFGTITINNATSTGLSDIFIAKFDALGNCIWATAVGGTGDDFGLAVAVDNLGNVYATGSFKSTSVTFGSQTIINNGFSDIFILQLNSAGTPQWINGIGGNDDETGTGLSFDINNNIYVTGYFWSSTVNFGVQTVNNAGSPDIFIAKFNSAGTNVWAKAMGGSDSDRGLAIKTDDNGNSFITGFYSSSSVLFDAINLANSSGGDDYLFIAKYDNNGNALWAKSASSLSGGTWGNSVSIDQNGNSYVGGVFDGSTATFGTNTITNSVSGNSNAFVAKYNSAGTNLWAVNPVSRPNGNETYCIAADSLGNTYISGWYTSPSVDFGGIVLNSIAAGDNIFMAKYNTSGVIQNAYSFSGTANSGGYGNAISVDNNGSIYLTGYFEGINMTFGSTTLNNTGSFDVYWAKLISGTTGITDKIAIGYMSIFPNPFSSTTTIKTNDNLQNATLIIYNQFGQIIKQKNNLTGETILINRDNLSAGIYFLQLSENNKIRTAKLIIK